MDGGDEYNFDFGKAGKKVKSPQTWKADKAPDVRSSYSGSANAAPIAAASDVRASAPANVMDKAASMLAKYSNPPQKRANQPPKSSMNFDIDDMSLDSSGSSAESRGYNSKNKYEMSFSPPETMFSPEDKKLKVSHI